jgi:hypothetical protein
VFAGGEHAPEPVGDHVHGTTTSNRFFNPSPFTDMLWRVSFRRLIEV